MRQTQRLSTSQIQAIKLLEYPTLELEERIAQEVQDNPALEEAPEEDEHRDEEEDAYQEDQDGGNDEQFDIDPYINDDETPDYQMRANNSSRDEQRVEIPFSAGVTFQENLLEQLGLQQITPTERHLAEVVIGNLDSDGYLRRDAENMVDDLAFRQGETFTDEDMRRAIKIVQTLDPAGIGATDLRECLLLQLERRQPTPAIQNAQKVLQRAFDDFSHRRFERIKDRFGFTDEDMREVIEEITRLNPKPGSSWSGNIYERNQTTIVPDFIVENDNGNLYVSLNNSNLPELRVNREYAQMVKEYNGNKQNRTRQMREAITFMRERMEKAQWFIDAIRQRNNTLMYVMNVIVDFQHDFFIEGDDAFLRPMVLQDIADRTGFDTSTISRVSNSKYVQTDFGVFPLKHFFSESFTDAEGNEISNKAIQSILSEHIAAEDKRHPLTDDQLVVLLKQQGYNVARRTIAKYREQMGIASSRLRREI